MSRSKRKTPILGMTKWSSKPSAQKKFRKQEHKAERTKVHQDLKIEKEILPHPKEYGNEWSSPRDGKQYLGYHKNDPEWAEDYKRWMRK